MPELPEVETMCRGIVAIVGQKVIAVEEPGCDYRPCLIRPPISEIHQNLRNHHVTAIARRGKRVMILLDSGNRLVIEPRMSGLVLLQDLDASQSASGLDTRYLRLRIRFPSVTLLVWDRRGLGTIRLLDEIEFENQVNAKLGPDALEIATAEFQSRFNGSRRAIKVALLDQSLVAGIGNLYASEILFLAAVDPRKPCNQLSPRQYDRIHQSMRAVLNDAIAHEGSTLSDGTYRNALADPGNYQNLHRVYDRENEDCRQCRIGRIRRIVQAQRSTFFCPKCQRR